VAVVRKDEIRRRLIDALAAAKRRDADELEAEMLLAGPECPFDSIYLVRVGVRIARDLGISLAPSPRIADRFKSIDALAGLLSEIAQGKEVA
jgi:hypothetical protein